MLRPPRANSTIRRRYSAAYGGCVRGIGKLLFLIPNTLYETGSTSPKVFADHLGRTDEFSERKLAELYEQVGRLMVERDFLLRRSGV
jgi:hypothetical protein